MATTGIQAQLRLRNILVTTDFSEASGQALEYAIGLAQKHGSKIVVLHAVQPEPFTRVPLDSLHECGALPQIEAERKMSRFAEDRSFAGLQHQEVVRRGFIWDLVGAAARENAVDLIVLATHGRTGVKHLVMGSVAEKIFRSSACPVMTIGPRAAGGSRKLRKVLFTTDFSESAGRALPYAVALARESGALLIALHIANFVFAEGTDLRPEALFAAERLLHEKIPPPEGLAGFQCLVRLGAAVSGILSTAEEHRADLIVMGLRRHSAMSAHLPWTTAHQIVTHAKCPVLTVR